MKATLLIGGSSDEHKRHEMDFYPTPPECTIALLKFLKIGTDKNTIWEPACGDGAISKVLINHGFSVVSTDIRDDVYGEGGIDFLTAPKKADIIITNPPFDLAEMFIEKCHQLEIGVYCLLLKSTYWHSKNRLKLFEKTKPFYILPLTWRPNFAPNRGSSPTMDMIWTVWIKGTDECRYIPLRKPVNEEINLFS